ncbi:MAG: YtpI family protein [Paenibacillaceae bacterium]
MLSAFSFILTAVILISLMSTVFYSFRSRTQSDANMRGILAAKMNISMGFMLIAMALLQIFLFEANTMRTILGIVFLLLGLFNFFSGVRNHMHYRSRKQ